MMQSEIFLHLLSENRYFTRNSDFNEIIDNNSLPDDRRYYLLPCPIVGWIIIELINSIINYLIEANSQLEIFDVH